MYRSCRRAGKTPRSSNDCLIAQLAVEHALVLLHDDRDFEAIAAVIPDLRLDPIKR
jgi:predicted nucleic acid-binding protein